MSTIKQGDTHDIVLTTNGDLTGATVRLLARVVGTETPIELEGEVTGVREYTHTLTGTLDPGDYDVELEADKDGVIRTYPNRGYLRLTVVAQID